MRKKWQMANGKWQIVNLPLGFTLIELLVSMMIMMVVGTMIITVFLSALRGANKSQVLISARQNGNFALSQMSREIRQAENVMCSQGVNSPSSSVQVTSGKDQSITTYQCTGTNISSGSALLLDDTQVQTASCSFTCGVRPPLNIPYVMISFSLTHAGNPSLPERQLASPITFTTTVLLRNTPEE